MTEGKKALCVGINKFKHYPEHGLSGCVNDSMDMASLLKELCGFSTTDVKVLNDEMATKANIMNSLKSMVEGAKAGNSKHLVFSMSSHGSYVPDDDGEEPDRRDEVFAPYDLDNAGDVWDRKYAITDDEFRELFSQLPNNVLLEVYLDTCHSGDGIKGWTQDWKPRFLPPPSWKVFANSEALRTHGLREALLEKGIHNHILWAACRSDQTSADAPIGDDYHGAFTYYYCKHFRKYQKQITRKQLLGKVKSSLKPRFWQQPQLECDEEHSGARF